MLYDKGKKKDYNDRQSGKHFFLCASHVYYTFCYHYYYKNNTIVLLMYNYQFQIIYD